MEVKTNCNHCDQLSNNIRSGITTIMVMIPLVQAYCRSNRASPSTIWSRQYRYETFTAQGTATLGCEVQEPFGAVCLLRAFDLKCRGDMRSSSEGCNDGAVFFVAQSNSLIYRRFIQIDPFNHMAEDQLRERSWIRSLLHPLAFDFDAVCRNFLALLFEDLEDVHG